MYCDQLSKHSIFIQMDSFFKQSKTKLWIITKKVFLFLIVERLSMQRWSLLTFTQLKELDMNSCIQHQQHGTLNSYTITSHPSPSPSQISWCLEREIKCIMYNLCGNHKNNMTNMQLLKGNICNRERGLELHNLMTQLLQKPHNYGCLCWVKFVILLFPLILYSLSYNLLYITLDEACRKMTASAHTLVKAMLTVFVRAMVLEHNVVGIYTQSLMAQVAGLQVFHLFLCYL